MSDASAPASSAPAPAASTPSAAPSSTPSTSSAPAASSSTGPVRTATGQFAPKAVAEAAAANPDPVNTEPGAVAGETPAETRQRLGKHKIKVYGQEEEVDLDALSPEDLVREIQMGRAGRRAMQERADTIKKFQEFQKFVKENPWEALKDPAFGVDLEKLAEERLAEKYREMTLTPEQREALQHKRELEEYRKREAAQREQAEAQQRTQFEQQVFQEMEQTVTKAFAEEELPRNPKTLLMMAQLGRLNIERGIELTPRQLAAEVRRELGDIHQTVTRGLKGESLLKHLGPDAVKEVLRLSVEKARAARKPAFAAPPAAEQTKVTPSDEPQKKTYISESEWRKKMRS